MAQLFIESLESVNEIDDSFSRVGASGLGTEMGAAPEGTVGINRATAIRAEQGAGSGRVWLQACASRCPDTFGCVKSLSMGHQWHPARLAKMAATRPQGACTLDRPSLDLCIDGLQFRLKIESGLFLASPSHASLMHESPMWQTKKLVWRVLSMA